MGKRRPRRGNRLKCLECERAGKSDPWYDASEFYAIRRRPDGSVGTYDCYCKPCRRQYSAEINRIRARTDPTFREKHRRRSRRLKQDAKRAYAGEMRARQEETQRLTRRLMELRWRQIDIAAVIGCTQHTVSDWVAGIRPRNGNHLPVLRRLVRETEDGVLAPPVRAHRAPSWLRAP